MVKEEIRKGPWTNEEDAQLAFYVNLFGDRRWDFIAKVSGLKRTGKSCRLRWVNYLHPSLKRGKMTPHEERLVVELHTKWGNRWSKIAGKLPGRTDNEVKNYWRTYMRKKAQEKKKAMSSSSSLSTISSSSSSSPSSNSSTVDSKKIEEAKERNFYDTGGLDMFDSTANKSNYREDLSHEVYSMDEIWNDIELCGSDDIINDRFSEEGCGFPCSPMASPVWDYCPDMLWKMDDEESIKMSMPMCDNQLQCSFHNQENKFLTG